jgi:predicted RNA-binding protein with PUA-like domain
MRLTARGGHLFLSPLTSHLVTTSTHGLLADASQFDAESPHFDPQAKRSAPRWRLVDVKLVKQTPLLPLADGRKSP